MSEDQHINDDGDLRKYRTEIPNIADDELDPYEYRLYAHYKRVGDCWESVRTTAEKTRMSVGQVVDTRNSLEKKGWIVCGDDPLHGTIRIAVKDRWAENFQRYAGVHTVNKVFTTRTHRSRGEPKKEPVKKEPSKKEDTPPAPKERDDYFDAIAAVTALDLKAITPTQGGEIGRCKKQLIARQWKPDDILRWFAWFKNNHWLGKKGEYLRPSQIPGEMAKLDWRGGSSPSIAYVGPRTEQI